ncbi:MAG: rod shape-determining protein RodA [Bacteroidales bacterium]|nr:rod shape-determining protein RodA [Bacteroidales bacterium]
MGSRRINLWTELDWWTVLMYLSLVLIGWISIYASTYDFDHASIFDFAERSGKQLLWIGLAIVIGFIIIMLDSDIYDRFAYLMYGGMILLLFATIFLAPDIKGSRSWLVLGPVSLQPAEFGKFATALALAKMFSEYQFQFTKLKNYVRVGLLVLVPFLLILMQKETGSALVYSAFLIMLYREGMSPLIMLGGFVTATLFIVSLKFADTIIGITPIGDMLVYLIIQSIIVLYILFTSRKQFIAQYIIFGTAALFLLFGIASWIGLSVNFAWIALFSNFAAIIYIIIMILKENINELWIIILIAISSLLFSLSVNYVFNQVLEPHQQVRIRVSLGLEDDPRGVGYNVNQSKIAIGSGGVIGKGFLNGTQTKLKYVPEQDTDFIFCTIGEEEGFWGSAGTILLFGALILRLIYVAERQRTIFSRIYGYSVASIFLFHLVINIGMVTGITPVIGIPLPFFSYGGSSLWGFTILLFIFLRLDVARLERL